AAAGGNQANPNLDEANVRFGQRTRMVAMHNHFAATAKRPTGWRCHDGNGAVLEHLVRLLKVVDGFVKHLPFALPGSHQHQQQIRARRKVRRLIADDQGAELAGSLLNGVAQHFNDAFIYGVHLGMELKAGHTVTQINQSCRAVISYHFVASFKRRERDDALRSGYGLIAIGLEVEVLRNVPRSNAAVASSFAQERGVEVTTLSDRSG